MRVRFLKVVMLTCLVFFAVYLLPFLIVSQTSSAEIKSSVDNLEVADAIIIFGTLVNENGDINPLLKERLEAGRAIFEAGKSKKIVVSNTEEASQVMAEYFFEAGVPENAVELDTQAVITADTCAYEKERYPEMRKLIFVSQGFHLPRLMFQCKKLGVLGTGFSAEASGIIDKLQYSIFTKISVRAKRYLREAGLMWHAVFSKYET